MRMANILLDNLRDAVTERLCDAAAAEDLVLAGVHFAYNLVDAGTWAWIISCFLSYFKRGEVVTCGFLTSSLSILDFLGPSPVFIGMNELSVIDPSLTPDNLLWTSLLL